MFNLALPAYAFDLIYTNQRPISPPTHPQRITQIPLVMNMMEHNGTELTSNPHHGTRLLASNKKHDIPLTSIDIIVLEEKRLVDTILLQRRELDQQVQRACKRLLQHQVFLAADLPNAQLEHDFNFFSFSHL